MVTLRDAARILKIPLEDIEVTLTFKSNLPPGDDPLAIERTRRLRIAKIRREIRLIGDLTDAERAALMQEAACCPVSNTLAQSVKIEDVAGA
ncbi:MAG: OsmC family protein [Nitrospinota bacterium]